MLGRKSGSVRNSLLLEYVKLIWIGEYHCQSLVAFTDSKYSANLGFCTGNSIQAPSVHGPNSCGFGSTFDGRPLFGCYPKGHRGMVVIYLGSHCSMNRERMGVNFPESCRFLLSLCPNDNVSTLIVLRGLHAANENACVKNLGSQSM